MFNHCKRIVLSVLVGVTLATAMLAGGRSPAQADDEATRIYKLARALQDDDIKNENLTSWVNGDIGSVTGVKPDGLNVGQPMPDFKFSVFEQKSSITSTALKPPYLMNFWASWCGPCREEFPLINKNITEGKLPVPAYLVNVNDTKADAELFLLTYPTTLKVLVDDRNAFSAQTMMAAIPQTVLVDANGNIQAIQSGNMTDVALAFFDEIAANPGIGAFDRQHPDQMPTAAHPAYLIF